MIGHCCRAGRIGEHFLTRIFVGNLPFQMTETDLRSAFECFGKVASVQLVADRVTGKSRGFAFVAMPRLDDADEAITQLNRKSFHGRSLVVNEAREREQSARPPEISRWHLV